MCLRFRELDLGGPHGQVTEHEVAARLLFPQSATRQRAERLRH